MLSRLSAIVVGSLLITAQFFGSSERAKPQSLPQPQPADLLISSHGYGGGVPTTAHCLAVDHRACYSPLQLQTAYNMEPLFNAGLSGRGQTIAIVDAFGSPTIRNDLSQFDQAFSLPSPPSFKIITPVGAIPRYSPSAPDRSGWAFETTLDIECAHAMAPAANLLLVETPVDETLGVTGFPKIVTAENYVINHHMASVISQSFGAPEATFPDAHSIMSLRSAYKNARSHHVTILASSGDAGPSGDETTSGTLFTHRVVSWPASDPLVTAIGGTQLHLDDTGARTQPDNVWNDHPNGGGAEAGGGGLSTVFQRPIFQDAVSSVVNKARGIPDLSLSADPNGGALIYTSFPGPLTGFHTIGGTSESSPLFAGIVADANQANGSSLGFLNPKLYKLGAASPGLPDVTIGNTDLQFTQGGKTVKVQGFKAVAGYDMATGLGTIDGAKLVAALTGASL